MKRLIITALLTACLAAVFAQDRSFEKTGRIPRDLIPYHYDVTIRPDINHFEPPFPSSGKVLVFFDVVKATDVIHLNVKRLTIKYNSVKIYSDSLSSKPIASPVFTSLKYRPDIDFVSFHLLKPLDVGFKYVLELEYEGVMDRPGADGLYWDHYKALDGTTKYIAATQLESIDARKAFPCMDEVDMKATFRIAVDKKPKQHVAISNMPVLRHERLSDGWTRVLFDTTPRMNTYLVCIVVGEFLKVSAPSPYGTNISISLYATEKQVDNLEYIRTFAATRLQKWFDDYTKVPYNEPKMDHVALPNKGGAMENWGLITYGEEILCAHNETSSVVGKFNGVTIVSHEIAHMWYGNLVTCKWWNDLWVQEGFATFYNYNPTEYLEWDWQSTQLSDVRRGVQAQMTADQKIATTHTVRRAVDTPQQSEAAFTTGAYNKGGAILRMVHGILTRNVKEKAFTTFLKRFSYSNADTKDLTKVLDEAAAKANISNSDRSPLNFQKILDSWLNLPGFPVVTLSKVNSSTLLLTQQLFLNPSKQNISFEDRFSWTIPVTLVTDESTPTAWDGPATDWIPFKKDLHLTLPSNTLWYVINPRQYYYYRVKYDETNRKQLANQIKINFKGIPAETRSQLLEDYFEFTRVLTAGMDEAMDFTVKLEQDFSHNTWQVALKHIHAVEGFFRDHPLHKKLLSYFQQKLDHVLDRLSYVFNEHEDVSTSFLRKDTFSSACSFGSKKCLSFAAEKFTEYIKKPTVNSIDANLVPTVLCNGVFRGNQQDFEMVKKEYIRRKESQVKDERHAYAFALTCTSNNDKLESLVREVLEGGLFREKDLNQVTQYLAATQYGAERLFRHIDENWDDKMTFNKFTTLTTITNKWHTEQHIQKFKDFLERRQNNTEHPLKDSEVERLELNRLQINDNNRFFKQQATPLNSWLDRNHKPSAIEHFSPKVAASNPPAAFHHWQLLDESYHNDMVGKKYWE